MNNRNNIPPRGSTGRPPQGGEQRRLHRTVSPPNETARRQTSVGRQYSEPGAKPTVRTAQRPAPRRAVNPSARMTAKPAAPQKPQRPAKPAVRDKDIIRESDILHKDGQLDRPLLVIIIVLVCIGAVMVFSASYAYAYSKTGDSLYYIKRHIVYALAGIAIAVVVGKCLTIGFLRFWTPLAYMVTLGLLVAVLFVGSSEGEARRWIPLPFIGGFQPSELLKLTMVMMLAWFAERNESKVYRFYNEKNGNRWHDTKLFWHSTLFGVIVPFMIVALSCGLVALEMHLSGTIIIFSIGFVVVFAGGAILRWLICGVGFMGGAAGIMIAVVPYMRKRLDMFIHPEKYDPTDDIWQTLQGLSAVGSGGLLGVGLGQSRQKHMYVSQPQNDFIFSIVCEELGFIGAVCILLIFAALIVRGFTIAKKAPDTYSRLLAVGITSHIAIQVLLNVMVVTSMIPNTGVSLPFFSYGGSSLICLMAEMAVLLCISKYSIQQK